MSQNDSTMVEAEPDPPVNSFIVVLVKDVIDTHNIRLVRI